MARMRPMNLTITPFVFRLRGPVEPRAQRGGDAACTGCRWATLLGPGPAVDAWTTCTRATSMQFPCLRVDELVIWGLTYRMFMGFQERFRAGAGRDRERVKVVLTIAGSDSGGGAGIQADLRTFAAHGVHGTSAITAVTAQNSVAVTDWVALEPRMVVAQIEAVASDMPVAAVKTGMLANAGDRRRRWRRRSRRLRLPYLVVDPVMVAKGGDRLLDPDAETAYVERLFPLATVLTPNLPEAEALLGRPVRTLDEMREAARDLRARGRARWW